MGRLPVDFRLAPLVKHYFTAWTADGTDTCGWLLAVLVTGAHVKDRDAGQVLAWIIRTVSPLSASSGPTADTPASWSIYASSVLGLTVQIVSKLA